jgi:hypothetical protein
MFMGVSKKKWRSEGAAFEAASGIRLVMPGLRRGGESAGASAVAEAHDHEADSLMPRPCCVLSRARALAPLTRSALAQLIELQPDGTLVRRSGHFAGRPVARSRFLVTLDGVRFQLETSKVIAFLADLVAEWPTRANAHNRSGRNGPRTAADRRIADERLFALMRAQPHAAVRALARMLGISHAGLSRRVMKMKELRTVEIDGDGAWSVPPAPPPTRPWIRPVSDYVRRETREGQSARFG